MVADHLDALEGFGLAEGRGAHAPFSCAHGV
jgi:hypothetical protein